MKTSKNQVMRVAFELLHQHECSAAITRIMRQQIKELQPIDPMADRQREADRLREVADENGFVHIEVWGRDCDMCESTCVTKIRPNRMALEALERHVYECAEGPTSLTILTPDEAAEFEPSFRDRVTEAWENGRSNFSV